MCLQQQFESHSSPVGVSSFEKKKISRVLGIISSNLGVSLLSCGKKNVTKLCTYV